MTARYSSTLSRGLSCAPSKAGDFHGSELERVVQELTEKVASMCEKHMDEKTTTRPTNPNQGWRGGGKGKDSSRPRLGPTRVLRANPAEAPAGPKGLPKTLADISWMWQLLQSSSPSGD